MRNILKKLVLLIGITSPILFTGCGGGSGGSFSGASSKVNVASCAGAVSTWTTVNSGDVVVGDVGAILKFDHDSSNNKKVCVQTGTAYVTPAS